MSEKKPPLEPDEILPPKIERQQQRDDFAEPAEISQYDLAQMLVAQNRNELRFDHDRGKWFRWDGSRWRLEKRGLAFHRAAQLAAIESHGWDVKTKREARKANFASGILKIASSWPGIATGAEQWDQDGDLLGTPGGIINLRTGELIKPEPGYHISRATACAPTKTADCPRWLDFLSEATGGDEALQQFLRRWSGYGLTGHTTEQKLLFIWGGGGNGKSVWNSTISGIAAEYHVEAPMSVFEAARFRGHPTELAMLAGARMVSAVETDRGSSWDEQRVKVLTGGDQISARFMRQDFFTFLPRFTLTVVGIHMPQLQSVGDAIARRFLVAAFNRKPKRINLKLVEDLKSEWPQILRWMIDGAVEWFSDGLVIPDCVKAATADYLSEQDIFQNWLEECCIVERGTTHRWETPTVLFESWSAFCRRSGVDAGTQPGFAEMLGANGFPRAKPTNARKRHHTGIELKPNDYQRARDGDHNAP